MPIALPDGRELVTLRDAGEYACSNEDDDVFDSIEAVSRR
jgi:hypothetical protein